MDDRTLYGGQTRNRSRLKGHVGLLRGFSPGGGRYSIQLTEALQCNTCHAGLLSGVSYQGEVGPRLLRDTL